MKQLDLGRSTLTFEHKGEIYRLGGDLSGDTFVAWRDWSEKLTPEGERGELTEKEKDKVIDIVKKYWNNKRCIIDFVDNNLHVIYTTEKIKG